jgi:hypothetical protein
MVVIPKPNKPDYSNPKAYHPIALLNCLGKVLEKLKATRLSSMSGSHNLLHPDQIGGRPQRSAIDAVMALVHDIDIAKSRNLTSAALFLDVWGAFDNISSDRLLHTLCHLGCPQPHHIAMATPPLHLQQPAPKPSIFPSDSDSQHSFTYLGKFSGSSTLISLISVTKSEFSRVLAHPTMRNATKTLPTPRPTSQTVWERVPRPCGPS